MTETINRSFKRKKLALLKGEVKDFHPVLDKIFPQLPRVSHVEYTHGPNEKGADFVLSRTDDAIGDVEYIGTIVKVGNISVSLTSIFDQIDDCESKRILFNGKKKILLDEIWIITNENITRRAKEKINDRYKLRKVKFINRDNLIKWIDEFLPNFWVAVPLEIGSYLSSLKSSILEMDSAFSLLPSGVDPFYVDQDLRKIEHNYPKKKKKGSSHKSVHKWWFW